MPSLRSVVILPSVTIHQFVHIYFCLTTDVFKLDEDDMIGAVVPQMSEANDGGQSRTSIDGGQTIKKPEKVRSDFPETWIWAQRIAG